MKHFFLDFEMAKTLVKELESSEPNIVKLQGILKA